jgi:threo-3-hydroxy-L-aspartate ammonia-lyase
MSAPGAASPASGPGGLPTREAMAARLEDAIPRVSAVAHRTPVATSRTLDERTGAHVFLKCENLQRMGAFKFRGAFNTISRLAPEALQRGVIAYSSGNHAQAVALVARMLGAPAVIVMPSHAPRPKLEATRGYGAEVVFYDVLGEEREALAARLAGERGLTLVPPFDHPDIIAGAGTAAVELFEDAGPMDLLLVPVGGGGLISGSALAADAKCGERCRVIGVEPETGDDACRSFREGRIVRIAPPVTIADGARTPSVGPLTFEMMRRHVDGLTTVPDRALIETMRFVWERVKLVVEPTGVLGLAALLDGRIRADGQRVGVILSGGNVELARVGEWFGGA